MTLRRFAVPALLACSIAFPLACSSDAPTAEAKPCPSAEAQPEPDPKPEPKPEPKPDPKPDPKPEPPPDITPPVRETVTVKAGAFSSGCDSDRFVCAGEVNQITLPAYTIDRFEVTESEYALCVQARRCPAPSSGLPWPPAAQSKLPVRNVSMLGAERFCHWVGEQLPTAAQWEKAARGTDGRKFPWGDEELHCRYAAIKECVTAPQAVGSFPDGGSPYGALDMIGNVAEFVAIAQSGNGVDFSKNGGSYLTDPSFLKIYSPLVGGAISQEYTADLETGFRCARWQ